MSRVHLRFAGGLTCLLVLVGCSEESRQRQQERRAIEYCVSQAEERQKAVTPEVSRFMFATCQMMRDDFRSKWGRNP